MLRRSEDAYVDELFSGVVDSGAPMMRAHFPRAYLDLNREPYELDPKMFHDHLPPYANIRSIRVAGGLGTVARVVSDNQEIYTKRMAVGEALDRIEAIYKPYHQVLRRVLAQTHVAFGCSILVDCHSMPSIVRSGDGNSKPDFILGDRYGTSCAPDITECAADILRAMGYSVSRNKPYAGGFITEHYGRPVKGLHAIQIEVNRALYMDERAYARSSNFQALAADLTLFSRNLMCMAKDNLLPERAAAE
jgi:N-formylglutamate amidohydrolase